MLISAEVFSLDKPLGPSEFQAPPIIIHFQRGVQAMKPKVDSTSLPIVLLVEVEGGGFFVYSSKELPTFGHVQKDFGTFCYKGVTRNEALRKLNFLVVKSDSVRNLAGHY